MAWYNNLFFKESPIQEEPKTPSKSEQAWSTDSIFGYYGPNFTSYNPDELVAKKGYNIYKQMLRDPQVKSAYQLINDIITQKSFRFVKPTEYQDDPVYDEMCDFFYHNINYTLKGTWSQALRAILSAKAHGFSVSEKVYFTEEVNGKPRWMIGAIKPKPFHSFDFKQDEFGNVLEIIQTQAFKKKTLDPDKFIVHVNHPEQNEIFGESDLRAAYTPFWYKQTVSRLWGIYLEKMAGGFFILKPGDNPQALDDAGLAKLKKMAANLQQSPTINLPKGWDSELIMPQNTSAYEDAIKHYDKQISKALLVPNLLGFSEQGNTGSHAQASTQFDVFMNVMNAQSERLAETLNEQLFSQLAWWNFGRKDYPRLVFDKYNETQKHEISLRWFDAIKNGAVVNTIDDENTVRELLGFNQREQENNDDIEEPEQEPEISEVPDDEGEEVEIEAKHHKKPKDDDKEMSFDEFDPTSNLASRYNFTDIAESLDRTEDVMKNDLSTMIDKAFTELQEGVTNLYRQMSAPQISGDRNVEELNVTEELDTLNNSISPETKRNMNKIIQDSLRVAYGEGRSMGVKAVEEATEESMMSDSQKHRIKLAAKLSKKLASKDLNWSVKDFSEGLRLDTAEKYFAAKAFSITGDLTQEMIEKARTQILNGIREGWSIDEIIRELEDSLPTILGSRNEETGEINKQKRARVETIARTNVSDAFNQANLAVYNDPDLGDFVEAYQYSAIMDSRTTEFCSRYNGRIFAKTDEVWSNITPPNHFNCRSTLVAVTAIDDWSPSVKARSSNGSLIQPSKGFGTING